MAPLLLARCCLPRGCHSLIAAGGIPWRRGDWGWEGGEDESGRVFYLSMSCDGLEAQSS